MSNSKMFAKIATGLALAGAASLANAGIIIDSNTQSFNLENATAITANSATNGNAVVSGAALTQNVTFAGFDSSLGTLTNVLVTFDTDWSLNGSINAASTLSNSEGGSTAFSAARGEIGGSYNVALIDPTSNDVQVAQSQSAFCFAIVGGCDQPADAEGDFDGSLDVSAIDLSEFLDDDITLSVSQALTSQLTGCYDSIAGLGDSNAAWSPTTECNVLNEDSAWTGALTVTYVYDDGNSVDVPEPATLALFGLGLAGLGFARRKQS